MGRIELGDRVKDKITGLEGIVTGRYEYLYGCLRMSVQPEKAKDGKPVESFVLDEPQLELLKKAVIVPPQGTTAKDEPKKERTHGPRNDPISRISPAR